MSVGMPQSIWLTKFGQIVCDAFDDVPYHVGSSVFSKEWRDVDVRLILEDEKFDRLFGSPSNETNSRLAAFTQPSAIFKLKKAQRTTICRIKVEVR